MATITQNNRDNFLTWQKVTGVFPLTRLQAQGLPNCAEGYNVSDLSLLQAVNDGGADEALVSAFWSNDGFDFYYANASTGLIYQKTVSTPYDISTILSSQTKDITAQDITPIEVRFNGDGTKFYFIGSANDKLFQYTASTPYDISTITYDSKSLDYSTEASGATGFHFSDTNIYIVGDSTIHQYSWTTDDLSTATLLRSKTIGTATYYSLFYRDESHLYITDITNDLVCEISILDGSIQRAILSNTGLVIDSPLGVFFNEGGFNMWVMAANDDITEYLVGCPE